MYCEECKTRVYERNFDARNRDVDTAAICEECLDKSKHIRCMGPSEKEFWEEDRIYLCKECYDELSSDSNYGENSDSEIDMAAFDPEMFQFLVN